MTALEKFGLSNSALPDEVTDRWRKLASVYHPDRGGEASEFARYRTLYFAALEEAMKPKPCVLCGGTGKTKLVNGFNSIEVPCSLCR